MNALWDEPAPRMNAGPAKKESYLDGRGARRTSPAGVRTTRPRAKHGCRAAFEIRKYDAGQYGQRMCFRDRFTW